MSNTTRKRKGPTTPPGFSWKQPIEMPPSTREEKIKNEMSVFFGEVDEPPEKNLKIITPRLVRVPSTSMSRQDGDTCFIHVIAKILTRLIEITSDDKEMNLFSEYSNVDSEDCNILFDTRQTPDIIKSIVELGDQCNERTYVKALIYRTIYNIIYDSSNKKSNGDPVGGFFSIQYFLNYCETMTDDNYFAYWETDDEDNFAVCADYIFNAYNAITLIKEEWENDQLIIIYIYKRDIIEDKYFIEALIKSVLRLGYYISIEVNCTQLLCHASTGHALTVVGYDDESNELILKNSWGSDNSYEDIMTDGRISTTRLSEDWFDAFTLIIPLYILDALDPYRTLEYTDHPIYGYTKSDRVLSLNSCLEYNLKNVKEIHDTEAGTETAKSTRLRIIIPKGIPLRQKMRIARGTSTRSNRLRVIIARGTSTRSNRLRAIPKNLKK